VSFAFRRDELLVELQGQGLIVARSSARPNHRSRGQSTRESKANPLSADWIVGERSNALVGYLAAISRKLDRPLARLGRSITRCDDLITDLLEYARMRELKRVELQLDAWLGEVLDEQKLPEGIWLKRDFTAPGVAVSLDPDRVRRVVINLFENACQALAEVDPAEAGRDRLLTVATRETGGVVQICFEDTGPGIPPEVLPRIFDPLFSTRSFGTGLGLPTVRQIVEQHGGRIEITSEPGQGTRVLIALPLSHALAELAA